VSDPANAAYATSPGARATSGGDANGGKLSSESVSLAAVVDPVVVTPTRVGHPCIEHAATESVNCNQPPSVPAAAELSTSTIFSCSVWHGGALPDPGETVAVAEAIADALGVATEAPCACDPMGLDGETEPAIPEQATTTAATPHAAQRNRTVRLMCWLRAGAEKKAIGSQGSLVHVDVHA